MVPNSSIWPLTLIDLMVEAGATFAMPVAAGERAFALVLDGGVRLGAGEREAAAGDVAWAAPAGEDATLDVCASDRAARLLLYTSPVIDEPVAFGGPFVMNTREEILEAFADLRAGKLTEPS